MRYKALASQLIEEIQARKWQQGERLPSLRRFSALYDVSLTTAQNCYHALEEQGWLLAKPQSGFYVSSPMQDLSVPVAPQFTSTPRAFDEIDRQRYQEGPLGEAQQTNPYISPPLGISRLSPRYFPQQAFQRSIKRVHLRQPELLTEYPEPAGSSPLRRVLAQHFEQYQLRLSPLEGVITGGCINAVKQAIEVTTQVGDRVAISSPSFNGLLQLLAALNRDIVEIPCTDQGIDLVQLEQHLKTGAVQAGLFSTSHMNPQGTSLSDQQKQRLAELANRYRVPIIEDDVYMEIGFGQTMPRPAKYWDSQGYLLWCGSVSKTLASGLRLGWCWPGRYLSAYSHHNNASSYGHNTLMQAALADFIVTGQYQKHLQKVRHRLFANICAYRAYLMRYLPPGTAISQPTGGMVLWVQVPGLDGDRFEQAIQASGLGVRLGKVFTTLDWYRDCFRVNVGWGLDDVVTEGVTIETCLEQLVSLVQQSVLSLHKQQSDRATQSRASKS
ncbi:PLP-dependent aminotransferase family protein [Aestuariirhabdus sp. Z084]|uniref:aminotransferase-like domain-containing protein n=1 Tax=Aestuariirhabdus haliotis TaxID=2918751 RepID=UPI00201B3FFA|nr:PLP-dependent aminotransferase family protein [Aestuariirhabdus haliotis]MCL6415269.1 PLP-dependent aminotransferase family protein [Aestuariirhabdus haliotis]MCL6419529.1 PLP-dependent aminotransferase family protein [Aestuariirhabdus haliotis]